MLVHYARGRAGRPTPTSLQDMGLFHRLFTGNSEVFNSAIETLRSEFNTKLNEQSSAIRLLSEEWEEVLDKLTAADHRIRMRLKKATESPTLDEQPQTVQEGLTAEDEVLQLETQLNAAGLLTPRNSRGPVPGS